MKKIFTLAVALFIMGSVSFAQDAAPKKEVTKKTKTVTKKDDKGAKATTKSSTTTKETKKDDAGKKKTTKTKKTETKTETKATK